MDDTYFNGRYSHSMHYSDRMIKLDRDHYTEEEEEELREDSTDMADKGQVSVSELSEDAGNISIADTHHSDAETADSSREVRGHTPKNVKCGASNATCVNAETAGRLEVGDVSVSDVKSGNKVPWGSVEATDAVEVPDTPSSDVECGSNAQSNGRTTAENVSGLADTFSASCVRTGALALSSNSGDPPPVQDVSLTSAQCGSDASPRCVSLKDASGVKCGSVPDAVTCGNGACGGRAGVTSQQEENLQHESKEEEDSMNYRKLFVGNIGYKQTWKDLRDLFSQFGKVVYAQVVNDHIKCRSRGIGFVEFASEDEALNCLMASKSETGLELDGRKLRLNYAVESKKSTFTVYPSIPCLPAAQPQEIREDMTALLKVDEWAIIFTYLTVPEQIRLERVCKLWRDMALQVWKRRTSLTCTGFYWRLALTERVLTSLLGRCGKRLSCLDLGPFTSLLKEYTMTIIAHYCPLVRKLSVKGVSATNVGMRELSKAATQLQWINLQKCHLVGEKGLWWLLKNCQELMHLDITGNGSITGKCFHMVGPALTYLHASDCGKLTDYCLEKIVEKCPSIQQLHLSHCHQLTEDCLPLVSKMAKLEVLDLSHNFAGVYISEKPWISLGNLHSLRELRLDSITQLTDNILEAIVAGCPRLRILTLQACRPNVSEKGLQFLLNLNELSTLDVSYIEAVDDIFLERLAFPGRLEKLVVRICPQINNGGVQKVLDFSPRLHWLDLSGNMTLTLYALTPLSSSPTLTLDQPSHLPLKVVIGGTMMTVEDSWEELSALKSTLPPHVSLEHANWSNQMFDPDPTLILPAPWSDDDDDDEEQGYNLPEAAAKGEDLPGADNPDHQQSETVTLDLPVYKPDLSWGSEEEWAPDTGEATHQQPLPTWSPASAAVAMNMAAFYDDMDSDGDYDEFLVNDDALELERWDLS